MTAWLIIPSGLLALVVFGWLMDSFWPLEDHRDERDPAAGLRK